MTAPIDPAELDRLDAVAAAATPGPWKLWGMQVMADPTGTSRLDCAVAVASTHFVDSGGHPRTFDATFIAVAREALPALVAEVRRLRERGAKVTCGWCRADFDRDAEGCPPPELATHLLSCEKNPFVQWERDQSASEDALRERAEAAEARVAALETCAENGHDEAPGVDGFDHVAACARCGARL